MGKWCEVSSVWVMVEVVRFSVDKPLDFNDTTFSVSPSLFKV